MKNNEISAYRQQNIANMSQKELIVFLYDSALNFLEEGKEKIEADDVPGTFEKLNRARKVFLHLLSTLNVDAGGEFARKLSSLYAYFIEKITMANVTKSIQDIDDIIPIIGEIRNAWANMNFSEDSVSMPKRGAESIQVVSLEA